MIRNKAKRRISKPVFQENKARQIFRKNEYFLPPDTHKSGYHGVRNVCFFGKFGVFCFLETSILRFALLPCYQSKNSEDISQLYIQSILSFKVYFFRKYHPNAVYFCHNPKGNRILTKNKNCFRTSNSQLPTLTCANNKIPSMDNTHFIDFEPRLNLITWISGDSMPKADRKQNMKLKKYALW